MLLADFKYAVRSLLKAPMFTAAAVGTLALGIGVNASMFSVLNTELLRPLPFANADRLVRVAERNDKLHLPDFSASILNYLSWKEKSDCFDQLGAVGSGSLALTGRGDPEQFASSTISPSILRLLGMRPIAGREFSEGEDRPGSPRVAMIGEALWRRLGASQSMIGQDLSLDGQPHRIVGVMPSSFSVIGPGDIFTPLVIDPARENRLNHVITVVARLKAGPSLLEAQSRMDSVSAQVGQEHPEVKEWGVRLIRFTDWFVPQALRSALLVLMGAVVLVLCIACANIASLLLSRGVARQSEVAVRVALGASRGDLVRQSLAESLVLALTGGLIGVALAAGAVRLMEVLLPANLLPIQDVRIDTAVLSFTALVVVLTSIGFGLPQALFAVRTDLNLVLKQGSRSATAGHSLSHRLLAALELGLATVLLIGGGLLMETLLRLEHVRLGFDATHVLTFELTPPPLRYPDRTQTLSFYDRLILALESRPGVEAVAISSGVPFGAGAYTRTPIAPVGRSVLDAGQSLPTDWRSVSPDFLRTLKIPLLSGRFLTPRDTGDALPVVVVTQKTAAAFWGSEEPLGKIVRVVGSGRQFTVVGVVGDVLNTSLDQPFIPAVYFSVAQRLWPTMDVIVRTHGNPELAISEARQVLRDLDPSLPLSTVKTMEQWIYASAAQPRLNAALVGLFAASALLIGVVGIYGVLSFSVGQRTREIGLRMALGAEQANVVQLVLAEGMTVAGIGIGLGLVGSVALNRILANLLFDAGGRDPWAYLAAPLVLAFAAAMACYIPARRASRIDPAIALRE